MTSGLGEVSTVAKSIVQLTGVGATLDLSSVLVYGNIDTDQTPNYTNVSTSQSAGYSGVSTSQSPGYDEIDAGRDAA